MEDTKFQREAFWHAPLAYLHFAEVEWIRRGVSILFPIFSQYAPKVISAFAPSAIANLLSQYQVSCRSFHQHCKRLRPERGSAPTYGYFELVLERIQIRGREYNGLSILDLLRWSNNLYQFAWFGERGQNTPLALRRVPRWMSAF